MIAIAPGLAIGKYIYQLQPMDVYYVHALHNAAPTEGNAMTAYRINLENTGLDNDEQAQAMAAAMQADGHDVEFTRMFGSVNEHAECPVGEQDWMRYLVAASNA